MTDVPVDPALIAQHAVHRHVWKPPARTHGGWFVACEDETCAAWWASPGPKVPTEVPGWMQATAGPSVVGTPMRVLRLTGSMWTSEELAPGERARHVCLIRDEQGVELGIIEYVGIKLKAGKGTTYGWRPLFSGWTASRLKTKRDAAFALVKKAKAS